ncbi:MAG: ABC transporter permease [Gracilibacteraceae bacterium]|jgi:ABC-type antimicrobial peptide transport system permease subunit|nr:ABC transporter permease [Gracilibacteraceae bacterium]
MKWTEIFKMGAGNLLRRKTRTLLTVLGVVIGATSIIVMLSIGFGLKASMHNQLGGTASLTIINVSEQSPEDKSAKSSQKKKPVLDPATVQKFKGLENVTAVTPQKTAFAHFISGRYVADISIIGVDPRFMDAFGFKLERGQLITPGTNEVIFGHSATYNFYNPQRSTWPNNDETVPPPVDVLNDTVKISFDGSYEEKRRQSGPKPKVFTVKPVGVNIENTEYSWNVYMDIDMLTKLAKDSGVESAKSVSKKEKFDTVLVKADKVENVLAVQDVIKNMGFKTYSSAEYVKSIEGTYNTLQLALGGIGAISLIVAAIGITNTMIMSIYERTREIGVMKVVGAAISDIRSLFLLEAGLIGLFGGLLGMILSYIISYVINTLVGSKASEMLGGGGHISIIPPWLVLAALGVSFAVGLVSGYLPARRAMKLSALQAIKTE